MRIMVEVGDPIVVLVKVVELEALVEVGGVNLKQSVVVYPLSLVISVNAARAEANTETEPCS
jgi:hypothetical protein